MALTKFFQKMVDKGVLSVESAEMLQAATKREKSQGCFVRRCKGPTLRDDYLCGRHSRLKADNEKKFWHLVRERNRDAGVFPASIHTEDDSNKGERHG